ncbi:MAG: rod shape-determining protein MreD [Spirochaetales bacterium]|nr:rod shape-determining protein MreD [Spirochaetales bacterium]
MIKSLLINIVIAGALVLLQSTVLHYIAVYSVIPDMVMIFLLFLSLKEGSRKGELIGFSSGILIDFLSLSPLGFHALIYLLIGFISGLPNKNVSTDSLLTQILFVTLSMIIKYILSALLIVVFSIETTSISLLGHNFLLELVYTLLLVPLVFTFANRIYDASHKKRVGL